MSLLSVSLVRTFVLKLILLYQVTPKNSFAITFSRLDILQHKNVTSYTIKIMRKKIDSVYFGMLHYPAVMLICTINQTIQDHLFFAQLKCGQKPINNLVIGMSFLGIKCKVGKTK